MTASSARPWHCDDQALAAFAAGTVDPISGASVETHLMTCAECRATVSQLYPQQLLDEVWEEVRERVEAPAPGPVERLLIWLGISEETARLLVSVPAMQGAWLVGLLCATSFALVATTLDDDFGLMTFLMIAPLAPLAGVAASFGGDADPAHELVSAAPYSPVRLLMLRTAGVLCTSVPLTVLVGLTLPGPGWLAIAWLTPAAAAVTLTLAIGPWVGHTVTATVLAATWAASVTSAAYAHDLLILIEPAVQTACLALAVLGAAGIAIRYRTLDTTTWRQS
ncbi:MAG TPA: zf-HC2 domain-containing protein [Nocardioidaceae bacterium]|nr:zf-HC2 domain-containing protein [Nocardioidaceae bacterium]